MLARCCPGQHGDPHEGVLQCGTMQLSWCCIIRQSSSALSFHPSCTWEHVGDGAMGQAAPCCQLPSVLPAHDGSRPSAVNLTLQCPSAPRQHSLPEQPPNGECTMEENRLALARQTQCLTTPAARKGLHFASSQCAPKRTSCWCRLGGDLAALG